MRIVLTQSIRQWAHTSTARAFRANRPDGERADALPATASQRAGVTRLACSPCAAVSDRNCTAVPTSSRSAWRTTLAASK